MVISAGERYKRTDEIPPDSAIEELKKFDSMYLGAIGQPDGKPGILEVGAGSRCFDVGVQLRRWIFPGKSHHLLCNRNEWTRHHSECARLS